MKKDIMKKGVISLLVLSMLSTPVSSYALTKEETVYSKLNTDGSFKKTLVNEHYYNENKDRTLEDLTDLKNIININSDSKVTINNNKVVMNSNGEDIYIQGETDKELPISEMITYKLNGKDIKLDDLLGKSGNVEITIKYTNNDKKFTYINGKGETLYTPFVVSTVTSFKGDNNSNLNITNGRVIDNGIGYTIVALSTPGLYESLNLKELKGLDEVKITMDTKSFELPTIYSVATPKVIDREDLDIFNKLDSAYSDIDKLGSAMKELKEGSETILENLNKVSDGSSKIFESLTIVLDNLDKISNGVLSLDEGLTKVVSGLESSKEDFDKISSKLEDIKKIEEANSQYINGLNTIKTSYEKLSSIPYEYLNEEQKLQLNTLKFTYDSFNLGNENSLINVLSLNNNAFEEMISAFSKVSNALNTLNTYLPVLKGGADTLSEGTLKLKEGVSILNSKMSELSDASLKITGGMDSFNNGLNEFNIKGITPIINIKNQTKDLTSKLRKLEELSNNYQSFSLKDNNTKSSTKIILVSEGKSIPKQTKKVEVSKKKENFFERLFDLFK